MATLSETLIDVSRSSLRPRVEFQPVLPMIRTDSKPDPALEPSRPEGGLGLAKAEETCRNAENGELLARLEGKMDLLLEATTGKSVSIHWRLSVPGTRR